MSAALNIHTLLEDALTHVPALSRQVLEQTQDELEARPQHFALLGEWRRLRGRFSADFEAALLPLLQAARRGEDPLQRRPATLDALSLVDEQQAQQDVAIAQLIQAIEQQSSAELHQLGNFFAALRGTARARKNENPLRPALFAQALHQATFGAELQPGSRYQLLQVAAAPLARGLHRLYADLCARLREADLSQMVASHAASDIDAGALKRFAQARLQGEPATLDGLARRVQQYNNSRPTPLGPAGAGAGAAPGFAPPPGPDMLSRLYDQILADPRLLPPLKAMLARLQVAVVRLARSDSSLLRRQDHPTWQLLNRVAAHGMAFERADDEQLQAFLRFMDAELQLLIDTPSPSALLFEQVLARVSQHLSSQAHSRSERSALALAALEREQMRPQWQQVLREQIDAQIAHAPLGPRLRRFLQSAWVEVIVQAMVSGGHDAPEARARIDFVDQLLDSLHTPAGEAERLRLRQRLPGLIQGLREGCEQIRLPEAKREPVLQELMHQHARLLRGMSALPESERARPAGKPELSPDEVLQRLLDERESQLSTHWAHTRVDRAELPTVPVQLYSEKDSPEARAALAQWIDAVQVGDWFHLFVQSNWLTAQLAWVSESRQFYLFVGQDAEERHSLTRGALEKLLANGLITTLAEEGVVQRAVETLMNDLDDAS
ncbi:MAG: DUF1631 family protein [Burkholderiaceae bacterium]